MVESVLKPRRSRFRHFQIAGIALLSLAALFVGGLNLVLNVGILPAEINQNPQALLMSWTSAVTVWPGKVWVRGLYIRSEDPFVQWDLSIDEAVAEVDLAAFLKRRFHASHISASGVSFRIRPRIKKGEEEAAKDHPPIAGLDPYAPADQTFPPLGDKVWSVLLENVDVERVREIWVADKRGELDSWMQGRVYFYPGKFVHVGPAKFVLRQGKFFQGDDVVVSGLHGQFDATLDADDLTAAAGDKVLRFVSATANFEGLLDSIGFFQGSFASSGLRLRGGRAHFALGAGIRLGALLPASKLQMEGEAFSAGWQPFRISGPWSATGVVIPEGQGTRADLVFKVAPFHVFGSSGAGRPLLESAHLRVNLEATDFVLSQPIKNGKITLDLSPTSPFPLTPLNELLAGSGWKIDAGKGKISAHLALGPGSPKKGGAIVINASGVEAGWERTRLQGDIRAELDLDRLKVRGRSADLSGSTLRFSHFVVSSGKGEKHYWDGKAKLASARLDLHPSVKGHAQIQGDFSDAWPFLSLFGEKAGIPGWAMPLLEAHGLKMKGEVGFGGSTFWIRKGQAEGDGLSIRAWLNLLPKEALGLFLVKVKGVGVGLKVTEGNVQSQLLAGDGWIEEKLAEEKTRSMAGGG